MSIHLSQLPIVIAALAAISFAGEEQDHTHLTSDSAGPSGHWGEPWEHAHFRNGTPLEHHFGLEPAFLCRDLIVDYSDLTFAEESEHEFELELEWALNNRVGFIIEQPYVISDPDTGSKSSGLGDLAVVPRVVVADGGPWVVAANLEVVAPTGSSSVGAGEHWHFAPFINTWCDLGNWWTFSSQAGLEFAPDSGEKEFFFALGVAKSLRVWDEAHGGDDHGHGHERHGGILTMMAELSGTAVVEGDPAEEGVYELEGLVGLSLGVIEGMDLRLGYRFPLNDNSELEKGLTIGAIHHF
ncbi:MAG: hypothetical protein GY872_09320 [Roseibacillus sp.]|nr:hypothetical protein [Roseibacillus sp.]